MTKDDVQRVVDAMPEPELEPEVEPEPKPVPVEAEVEVEAEPELEPEPEPVPVEAEAEVEPEPEDEPEAADDEELVPLSKMRQQIARVTIRSKSEKPHFYVNTDVDMTAAMALRAQINQAMAADGIRATVNDLIIAASVLALKRYPKFNAYYEDGGIRMNDGCKRRRSYGGRRGPDTARDRGRWRHVPQGGRPGQ